MEKEEAFTGAALARRVFFWHGHHIASYPFITLLVCSTVSALLALPSFDVSVTLQPHHTYETCTPDKQHREPPEWSAVRQPTARLLPIEVVMEGEGNVLCFDVLREAGFLIPKYDTAHSNTHKHAMHAMHTSTQAQTSTQHTRPPAPTLRNTRSAQASTRSHAYIPEHTINWPHSPSFPPLHMHCRN